MKRWIVTIKAFGVERTVQVQAETAEDAKAKALTHYNVRVEARETR
jgi:hypothetical protein